MVNGNMPIRRILFDSSVNMMPPEIIKINVDVLGDGKEIEAKGKLAMCWAKSVKNCTF